MQPRNMSMSGVVDLAAVKAAGEAKQKAEQARAEAARTGQAPASGARLVFDVDEAGFQQDVLQRSTEVPVVIDFWAEWCEPCKQLGPLLERLAGEYAGKFVLAKIDVDANQMLFQQFGVQGIPAVFAVVAGQPIPLFQGAAPEAQIREVLDQLVQAAEQQFGIVGAPVDPQAAGEPAQEAEAPGAGRSRTTPCWRPRTRRWTPAIWAAPSRPTRTCSTTIRPTRRPSSVWRRPSSCTACRTWIRRRCARRPRRTRPMCRRRSGPPTSIWSAGTSRTPSAGWSTR